jgi:hypothetical protein
VALERRKGWGLRTMTAPIHLTDEQLTEVMRLAAPLPIDMRTAFLERLAGELRALGELGDGAVYRIARQLQKEFFDAPDLNDQ